MLNEAQFNHNTNMIEYSQTPPTQNNSLLKLCMHITSESVFR